jgi:PAS domain S-box-containing protein
MATLNKYWALMSLITFLLGAGVIILGWKAYKSREARLIQLRAQAELLASLGEGVYGVDQSGYCTFINQSALKTLGYSVDEVLGQMQHALFHHHRQDGREYPTDECPIFQTLRDGKKRTGKEWFIRKNGIGFPVWFNVVRLDRPTSNTAALVTFWDTSIEDREHETSELFATVNQNLPVGFMLTDQDGLILLVNSMFQEMTGYSAEEAIGKSPKILQSGRHDNAFYRALWSTLLADGRWAGEVWNRKKNGEIYPQWLMINAVRINGAVKYYVATMVDYTEKHRREIELLKAKNDAEAALAVKNRFITIVSHEIRTPLNAILGHAQLLAMEEVQDSAIKNSIDEIGLSGKVLLKMLNDILDLSQLEAEKMTLSRQLFDPHAVVEEVITMFSGVAKGKRLYLIQDDQQCCGDVVGDANRVRQMLGNLVSNALKFTDLGGVKISVQCRTVEDGRKLVRFAVSDTGVGISSQNQEKLFKLFSQVDASNTRKHGGTGVGLTLVRQIAKKMGGGAGVDSVEGHGATFWFEMMSSPLGLLGADLLSAEKEGADMHESGKSLVMIVDDIPTNRLLIEAVLKKRGYAVCSASNGLEAYQYYLAHERRPDIILMDCQMPIMDGFEASQKIREFEQLELLPSVPIIALTGGVTEENRKLCLQAGMNEFVAKPVEMSALNGKIERLIVGVSPR